METGQFDRVTAFSPGTGETESTRKFKIEWLNENFRRSSLTWMSLFFLIIVFPGLQFASFDKSSMMLNSLDDTMRILTYVLTMALLWSLFALAYFTTYREQTGLKGLGFKKIRTVDFMYGIAFFLAAGGVVLPSFTWFLGKIGHPMPGEIGLLLPKENIGRVIWVFTSASAGICEETMFRGYLMTRLRLVGDFQNWVIPTIVSSIAFGICHSYQGWPGMLTISLYGAMFSLLFIYTRSIWPGVVAHFFQDFIALFIPQ